MIGKRTAKIFYGGISISTTGVGGEAPPLIIQVGEAVCRRLRQTGALMKSQPGRIIIAGSQQGRMIGSGFTRQWPSQQQAAIRGEFDDRAPFNYAAAGQADDCADIISPIRLEGIVGQRSVRNHIRWKS